MKRKICFVTGTRAEYGLMSRLMKLVKNDDQLELQIVATNMHLSPEFGMTAREIEADGLVIDKKVEMLLSADTPSSIAKSVGVEFIGLADAYRDLAPHLLVILGDRYEMLSAAATALFFGIPVAHISGGDVTEGAYDDAIRHAITKMSHLHFATTEVYRKRVVQLGEQPETVFNTGSLAIDNIRHTPLMSREELEKSINFGLGSRCVLATFHPVTLESEPADVQFDALLKALHKEGCNIIFTHPNADNGGRNIIQTINNYVAAHPEKAVAFASMGQMRYLSAMKWVDAVVGNSSSGIVEAPSMGTPTVNIGNRQAGRLQATSIINCRPREEAIARAIGRALSAPFRQVAANAINPYEQPNTAQRIYQVIKNHPLAEITRKRFYDLP